MYSGTSLAWYDQWWNQWKQYHHQREYMDSSLLYRQWQDQWWNQWKQCHHQLEYMDSSLLHRLDSSTLLLNRHPHYL